MVFQPLFIILMELHTTINDNGLTCNVFGYWINKEANAVYIVSDGRFNVISFAECLHTPFVVFSSIFPTIERYHTSSGVLTIPERRR